MWCREMPIRTSVIHHWTKTKLFCAKSVSRMVIEMNENIFSFVERMNSKMSPATLMLASILFKMEKDWYLWLFPCHYLAFVLLYKDRKFLFDWKKNVFLMHIFAGQRRTPGEMLIKWNLRQMNKKCKMHNKWIWFAFVELVFID